MCAVAVCAAGSMFAHEYEATTWNALRTASSLVAMPLQSSTRWMGLRGRMYPGMVARGGDEGLSLGEGLGGLGFPVGGVCGEIDAGQTGKGLVCYSEGGV
jgi:hypothetical protein